MMRFDGKVVLVTGSGRGIGRAIALRFAQDGANLILNYFRNRKPAEQTALEIRKLGREAMVVKANIGDLAELENLIEQGIIHFGGIDIFISNAASGYNRPVMQQRPKGWDWTMNINARALLFGAQMVAPSMHSRGGGAIVSISSPGSFRVLPEYVVVGASKAALEAITRYLAVEFAPMGIQVNAVSPGLVETEALAHFEATRGTGIMQSVAETTPAGRLVRAQDVAGVVAFLCSSEAEMIRGQTILIDGGYNLPAEGIKISGV